MVRDGGPPLTQTVLVVRILVALPTLREAGSDLFGIASALRTPYGFAATPNALGPALEGLVFQHLHAWAASMPGATLSTWRTTSGTEVDFVLQECHGLAWDALREDSS